MEDRARHTADRLRAQWRTVAASGDKAAITATADALLAFLRGVRHADNPREWGSVAVDAVAALLARHQITDSAADVEAAARLAEVVWQIGEMEPLEALEPLISCRSITQDLSVHADLGQWANLRLLELVLDRNSARRRPLLAAIRGLTAALRDEAGVRSSIEVDHRLWVRCVSDQMDTMAIDSDRLRLGWLEIALAFSVAATHGSDPHLAAIRAYEAAVAVVPTGDDPPPHYFWLLASKVAMRLAIERHPSDVIRVISATARLHEAFQDGGMSAEWRARYVDQRLAGLRGDDPALFAAQARDARAMLQEDLLPRQRTQVLRALLVILMKMVQSESTSRTRRELREVAGLLRGVQLDADDSAIVAALMLAARGESDMTALDETAEMLRPPPKVDVSWTRWLAYGRVLVARARAGEDADTARAVFAVADRLTLFGDEASHGSLELRRGALQVLARTGDREAAATLLTLESPSSSNLSVGLLRLDLRTDPLRDARALGVSLVALARPIANEMATDAVAVVDVVFALILEWATLSSRGAFEHLPDASDSGVKVLAAATAALDDDIDRALLAAHVVIHRDLDLGDRVALRNLAIESLRAADDVRPRIRVTLGRLLLERFARDRSEADVKEAAALLLSENPQDDREVDHAQLLIALIDQMRTTPLFLSRAVELHHREVFLLQHIAYSAKHDLGHRLDAARRLIEISSGIWPYIASIARAATENLASDLGGPTGSSVEVLERAQGLTARGAYAAAMGGDVAAAIELAERGQGVQAAVALGRHRTSARDAAVREPVLHRRWEKAKDELAAAIRSEQLSSGTPFLADLSIGIGSGVASDPPTRPLDRGEYFRQMSARSPHIADHLARFRQAQLELESATGQLAVEPDLVGLLAHVQAVGARLCYVVASPWGGVAIVLEPSGGLRAMELPELTEERTKEWIDAILDDARWSDRPHKDSPHPVRGPGPEPSMSATEDVLASMANALGDLASLLARDDAPVQLVPVGHLASLPLTAALQTTRGDDDWFDVSVAASGRLHVASAIRSDSTSGNTELLAITDARPTHDRSGQTLDRLPSAAAEGRRLEADYGATHFTAGRATAQEALRGLQSPHKVLHIAVHGDIDREQPERSCLYLVGDDDQTAQLMAEHLAALRIDTRLVFLGACWTGHPGLRLPDEAIGFPTILLQSGAAGVVAPSWPIDDRAALTFAITYYDGWVNRGLGAGQALAAAMQTTRRKHPNSPTWAAFALYGS